jgi:MFS family permease
VVTNGDKTNRRPGQALDCSVQADAILYFLRTKQLISAKRYAVEAQGQRFDIWEVIYYTDDLDGAKRYAAAISSIGAIGGAFALPLPSLIGWLSDRVERKRLLALSHLIGTVDLLILAASASLWRFWVVASLMAVFVSVSGAVGSRL